MSDAMRCEQAEWTTNW